MSQRMYDHMRNTLRDIKTIIQDDIPDAKKLKDIAFNISLLESVENGEIITSK